MPDVEVVEEKCMNSEKSFRGHTDLNHGPIGLQPIALPLSYIPCTVYSSSEQPGHSVYTCGSQRESSSGKTCCQMLYSLKISIVISLSSIYL